MKFVPKYHNGLVNDAWLTFGLTEFEFNILQRVLDDVRFGLTVIKSKEKAALERAYQKLFLDLK